MLPALSKKQKEEMEGLIDTHGLYNILECLAVICYEKQDHINTNWQDRKLAEAWGRIGARLETAAHHALHHQRLPT